MAVYFPDYPDTTEFWPGMIVPPDQYDPDVKLKVREYQIFMKFFELKEVNCTCN